MNHLIDPSLERCANCGRVLSQCDCTEDDMNRWAYDELYGDEEINQPMWELYPLEIESPYHYEDYDDDEPY